MDLALELGMTVHHLKCVMTERELVMWQHYADKKLLPTRRMEFYLAQVARSLSGGALKDYLLRPVAEAKAEEVELAVSSIAPGAFAHRLGQGRKREVH